MFAAITERATLTYVQKLEAGHYDYETTLELKRIERNARFIAEHKRAALQLAANLQTINHGYGVRLPRIAWKDIQAGHILQFGSVKAGDAYRVKVLQAYGERLQVVSVPNDYVGEGFMWNADDGAGPVTKPSMGPHKMPTIHSAGSGTYNEWRKSTWTGRARYVSLVWSAGQSRVTF